MAYSKIKKQLDFTIPLIPNVIAAIPIISLFFLETFLKVESSFRTDLVSYYLIVPFFPPISVVYLKVSNHFRNYLLITPIILCVVCLFLFFYFKEYLWYFINYCAFSVVRSLYNLNEIKNSIHLIIIIMVSLIFNLIFKHLFLGSTIIFIYAFYCFVNIKLNVNSKKINISSILFTIVTAYLASFGYGLIQSIDKVVTSDTGFFFYLLFLFSLVVSYFQNYYLNNSKTKWNSSVRSIVFSVTILTYVLLFDINNDLIKIFKLSFCYFVLFFYSNLNAFLDRNALIIKNIFWFLTGLYIYLSESFTPNVKLATIIVSMVFFEIIHKFLRKNESK